MNMHQQQIETDKLNLESIRTQRDQFIDVYSGQNFKVEVRSTPLGREVRLTLNAGSTIKIVFDEINAKSQEEYNCDIIDRATLYQDFRVNEIINETTVITLIPVLKDSESRVRSGKDAGTSHEGLLNMHGLNFVNRLYLATAAGAYRLQNGFQPGVPIGSLEDKGDLFGGHIIRSNIGGIGTSADRGIRIYNCHDLRSSPYLSVAGRRHKKE